MGTKTGGCIPNMGGPRTMKSFLFPVNSDLSKHERFTFDAQQTTRPHPTCRTFVLTSPVDGQSALYCEDRRDMTKKPKHVGHIVTVSYANLAESALPDRTASTFFFVFFVLMPSMSKTKEGLQKVCAPLSWLFFLVFPTETPAQKHIC